MIKTAVYHLILNYSCAEMEKKGTMDKEILYIKKHSDKIYENYNMGSLAKLELVSRLKRIEHICDSMTNTSHEMLAYISIDFLVNVERDTIARGKFAHINTMNKLLEWEVKYKKEYKEHLDFFSKIVDKL